MVAEHAVDWYAHLLTNDYLFNLYNAVLPTVTSYIIPADKFKVGQDLVPRMVSLWQRQPKEVQDNNNLKLGRFGTYATYMAGNFGKNYDVLESDLLLTTKELVASNAPTTKTL